MGAAILRAVGDSKSPLIFLIISCFTNIILDLVFVVLFKWGVMGAAVATITSQALSCALVLFKLVSSDDIYKLYPKEIKIHPYHLAKMFGLGLAAGLQSVMYTSANIMIQSSVNTLGTNSIAAYAAFSKIDPLYWMSMQALGIAITTVAGQNYGANNKKRVGQTFLISLVMAVVINAIASVSFISFGRNFFLLFTKDEDVISIGLHILNIMAFGYPLFIILEVYSDILRSIGDVWIPMILTAVGVCLTRVIWVVVMFPSHRVIDYIIYAYPLSWGIASTFFLVYMHGFSRFWKWLRKKA